MSEIKAPVYTGGKKVFMIIAVLLLMTTAMMANYGGSIVLPSKLTELGGMNFYSVISAINSMGMMLALPMVGILCSKFGVKMVTLAGVILQFVARLVLMRVTGVFAFGVLWTLVGFFTGLYISAPYAIMGAIVSPEERPKFYGLLATFSATGALAGPALTGFVIDKFSTNLGLVAYVVFAIIPFVGLALFYPNLKRPSSGKFDFFGLFLLVLSICGVVLWLSLGGKSFSFVSPVGLVLLIGGLICAALLIAVERKHSNPSVPIYMFKKKRFRYTFLVQMLLVAYSTCVAAYGIVFVTTVMQGSALVSSTVTMPQTIVQLILGVSVGTYVSKAFKKRFPTMGKLALVLYTVALLLLFTLKPTSSMIIIYIATGLGGIGQAISQSSFAAFFQTELNQEEFPAAQGMYQFASSGGATIFTGICGAALNAGFTLNHVFLLGAFFTGAATIIAFIGFRFSKEEVEAEAADVASRAAKA